MAVRRFPLLALLIATLGVFALAAGAALPPRPAAAPAPSIRTVVLEAKGTGFHAGGVENPVIEARPGERIRIVVRNVDPGVVHAIGVPTLESGNEAVPPGEEVSFEVTAAPGEHEYVCTYHCPLMRGKIIVRSSG